MWRNKFVKLSFDQQTFFHPTDTIYLVLVQEKLILEKEKVLDKLILTLTRRELLNFLF